MLYEKLSDGSVRCNLCAHRCVIAQGKRGTCHVRENGNGSLYTLAYGRIIAEHVDPVEKKPLYHFYPGSTAYSIATPGCNFRCEWCQNWEISQMLPPNPSRNNVSVTAGLRLTILVGGSGTGISFPSSSLNTRCITLAYMSWSAQQ